MANTEYPYDYEDSIQFLAQFCKKCIKSIRAENSYREVGGISLDTADYYKNNTLKYGIIAVELYREEKFLRYLL